MSPAKMNVSVGTVNIGFVVAVDVARREDSPNVVVVARVRRL